jgi:hypothetical protein
MSSEMGFRDGDAAELARRLEVFSMALFVVYAVRIAATAFPFRPLTTLWQLTLSSALLDAAAIPLVALCLLHLAAYLDPANSALGQRRDALARWAILAVLGFLLLVPLQALTAWNNVAAEQARVSREQTTATNNIALIRQAIHAATSIDDLQARLQSLQTPSLAIRFERIDLPLAETKRQLLLRLSDGEQQLKMRINPPPPEAIEDLVKNTLRGISASAVLAAAFAMAAQRKGSEVPLLVEILTIWSLQAAANPKGPGRGPITRRLLGSPAAREEDYFERLARREEEPSDPP